MRSETLYKPFTIDFEKKSVYVSKMTKSVFFFASFLLITSCSHVYYKSWELLGKEKRELLSSKMSALNEDQTEAKEEFANVLEEIRSKYSFKEGNLENTYDRMSSNYNDMNEEVEDLGSQIEDVESIAKDLFEEWKAEAKEFTNKDYERTSLQKLRVTRANFNEVLKESEATEKAMQKVLAKFHEQVIYVKHNLNAKAVGRLASELQNIQEVMRKLIQQINSSIQKADRFIKDFES